MRYQRSASFVADYERLAPRERELFKAAVRALNEAYDRRSGWPPAWPRTLRIKRVRGHATIWEMTWSFAGPAGRATFEIIDLEGEPCLRWRRIGGHSIFDEP